MATCEAGCARRWRDERRRWLGPLIAMLIIAGLGGIIVGPPPGRLAWLGGTVVALYTASWAAAAGYGAFIRRTDATWIADLRAAPADSDPWLIRGEMVERLAAPWSRRRARLIPEAIAACACWLAGPGKALPAGERRELVEALCGVARRAAGAEMAGLMTQLRRLLMDLDRGRCDPWTEPED